MRARLIAFFFAVTDEPKQQVREEDEYITPELIHETKSKEKFKILQNVKVPMVAQEQQQQDQSSQQTVALEPSSEAEALSNVATGIATSLGLVDIVVLNENQQYILQSNEQLQNSQSEFILPELGPAQFTAPNQTLTATQSEMPGEHSVITQSMLNSGDIASTDELVMVLTDHDYGDGNNELITNDNSNIVVLYSHPVDGQENQIITSQGNLMVNPQTGMIEIRNGSAIATSAPNTIVVTQAQDTHIESIEMIQQEINSHASAVQHVEQPEQQSGLMGEAPQQQEFAQASEEVQSRDAEQSVGGSEPEQVSGDGDGAVETKVEVLEESAEQQQQQEQQEEPRHDVGDEQLMVRRSNVPLEIYL